LTKRPKLHGGLRCTDGKYNFAEVLKNLAKYKFKNNYFVRASKYLGLNIDDNAIKSFNILEINLSVLHSYIEDPNNSIFRFVFS